MSNNSLDLIDLDKYIAKLNAILKGAELTVVGKVDDETHHKIDANTKDKIYFMLDSCLKEVIQKTMETLVDSDICPKESLRLLKQVSMSIVHFSVSINADMMDIRYQNSFYGFICATLLNTGLTKDEVGEFFSGFSIDNLEMNGETLSLKYNSKKEKEKNKYE